MMLVTKIAPPLPNKTAALLLTSPERMRMSSRRRRERVVERDGGEQHPGGVSAESRGVGEPKGVEPCQHHQQQDSSSTISGPARNQRVAPRDQHAAAVSATMSALSTGSRLSGSPASATTGCAVRRQRPGCSARLTNSSTADDGRVWCPSAQCVRHDEGHGVATRQHLDRGGGPRRSTRSHRTRRYGRCGRRAWPRVGCGRPRTAGWPIRRWVR
jgi:hypothetical protein